MAGHSKWKNIKHRKEVQDAKRGKVFTKIIREITTAARMGGSIANDNPRLRAVVDKALTHNMTRDTIERAIKRGAGAEDAEALEELVYEGYGPGGVAFYVEAMTDNRNRTAGEVRHVFTKMEGNLGSSGSVAYLFAKKGQLSFAPGANEDRILEVALEAGAEDVVTNDDGSIDVYTTPDCFGAVKDALDAAGLQAALAEVSMIAAVQVDVQESELVATLTQMIDMLEDLDDVQNVYINANL